MSVSTSVTDLISQMQETYGYTDEVSTSSSELDKDAFLNLLVTQMQYQDPLEPTDNSEYLAQMAQFSSLEQMSNLNTSYSMQQAYSLVGKSVSGYYTNDASGASEYVSGIVDYAAIKSGEAYVNVEGVDIAVADIEYVYDDISTDGEMLVEAIATLEDSLEEITEQLEVLTEAYESISSDDDSTDETTETSDDTDTETT